MAEQVQAALDQMVPALRDFLEKGIFSESEVRSIVKRRRESEYLLRRRAARKSDFLRYIQAEQALERLRDLRTRQLFRRRRQELAEQGESSISNRLDNRSIVQHIHFLFQRILRKWKSDVTLYIQHAEFAKKSKSHKMLGRIYAEALQIHPRNTGLWIESASHEFFGDQDSKAKNEEEEEEEEEEYDEESKDDDTIGGSILSARVLLQRGLRVNPKSQELWLQTFALELHYIQKLRGRKEILQLHLKSGDGFDLEQQRKSADGSMDNNEIFKNAQVPRLVYKNAIKSIPDNVQFRLKFMDLCQMFPQTELLETDIMSSIEKDFHDTPKAWIARAMYKLKKNPIENNIGFLAVLNNDDEESDDSDDNEEGKKLSSKKRKRDNDESMNLKVSAFQILEEATNEIKSPEMFMESINFMYEYISNNPDEDSDDSSRYSNPSNAVIFLDHLFNKAFAADILTPEIVLKYAEFLLNTGDPKKAFSMIQNAIESDTLCKANVKIWLRLSEIASRLRSANPGKFVGSKYNPTSILRKGLQYIPMDSAGHLILIQKIFHQNLMNYTLKRPKGSPDLLGDFTRILIFSQRLQNSSEAESFNSDDGILPVSTIGLMYVQYAMATSNIELIRKLLKAIFHSNIAKISSNSSSDDLDGFKTLFDLCICAEKLSFTRNGKDASSKHHSFNLKRLYDEIIRFFNVRGCHDIVRDYTKRKNEALL